MVLVFHGWGGSVARTERQEGWNQAADRYGFVVLYPEGIEQSFNAERNRDDALTRRFEEALNRAREEPITKPMRDFDLD